MIKKRRNAVKTTDLERGQYGIDNHTKVPVVDNRNGISKPLLEAQKSSLETSKTISKTVHLSEACFSKKRY